MKPESPLQWHEPTHVVKSLQRVYKVLRGNVSYGSLAVDDDGRNIDGYPATATTPGVANTEFIVAHGLNRNPVGFHLMTKNGATDVYQSRATLGDSSNVYLKATGINIAITLFIM